MFAGAARCSVQIPVGALHQIAQWVATIGPVEIDQGFEPYRVR